MSEYPPHASVSDATRLAIEPTLPAGWFVRPDKPLRIPNRSSVPEPDLVVTRGKPQDYFDQHPAAADVALVVAVADSRPREARDLIAVHGGGGVPIYWIVNLADRQVEIHTGPHSNGYQARLDVTPGQDAAVVVQGREVGRIVVADLFPRSCPPLADAAPTVVGNPTWRSRPCRHGQPNACEAQRPERRA